MGNCCRGQFSTPATTSCDPRVPTPKNSRCIKCDGENGDNSSFSSSSSNSNRSNGSNLREVKIRMTRKELEELVGWLNMADSSFEHVTARLVNIISDQSGDSKEDDNNNGEVVKFRQQHSWKPSLQSIPEMN